MRKLVTAPELHRDERLPTPQLDRVVVHSNARVGSHWHRAHVNVERSRQTHCTSIPRRIQRRAAVQIDCGPFELVRF